MCIRHVTLVLLCVASQLLGACATIVTGGDQLISLDSEPKGAQIKVDGISVATTPAQVKVDRRSGGVLISLELDGYRQGTVKPGTQFEAWFFGNFISGGLIGTTVDAATGSTVRYAPDSYFVELQPLDGYGYRNGSQSAYSKGEIKSYLLVAYEPIVDNILIGQGDHLNALLIQLEVNERDRNKAIRQLQSILTLSDGNVLKFADLVIEHFAPGAIKTQPSRSAVHSPIHTPQSKTDETPKPFF